MTESLDLDNHKKWPWYKTDARNERACQKYENCQV